MNVYWVKWQYQLHIPDCEGQLDSVQHREQFVTCVSPVVAEQRVRDSVTAMAEASGCVAMDLTITVTFAGSAIV